ncbi:MAG TPA: SPW repeat protein [Candidatus Acidoferrum sp.]|nr:SPW repeat protein [Candidatus Acidoferrum sp.]
MRNVPNFASWINIVVGILAIISPFALHDTSQGVIWSTVITGAVIVIAAVIELSVYPSSSNMNYWPVINVIAGIWLVISTSLAIGDVGMIWSNIVLGIMAIATAIVALGYERVHASGSQPAAR